MAKLAVADFAREVRQEFKRIVWPTRKEAGITTAMVFLMVTLASIFFLVADQIIAFVVRLILGIGG